MIEPFEAHWLPLNILECFPKNKLFLCNWIEKDVKILGEMGVSKLSGNFYSGSELIL